MEPETGFTIKGTRDGLTLLVSPESPLDEVLTQLSGKFQDESSFFQNAELVLDLGLRPFQEEEFRSLRRVFDTAGVRLKGIVSDNPITKLMAHEEGIELIGGRSIMHSRVRVDHPVKRERLAVREAPVESGTPRREAERQAQERSPDRKKNGSSAFAYRTLRAGQKLHHAGDVTILGDVNPGAEVVATGNIAVFGALRGVAHAGAEGNREAVVVALELRPTQLRIADCIARSPENAQAARSPELARIHDDAIVIEAYPHGK